MQFFVFLALIVIVGILPNPIYKTYSTLAAGS